MAWISSTIIFTIALGVIVQSCVLSYAVSVRLFKDVKSQWKVLWSSLWGRKKFLALMRDRERPVPFISEKWAVAFLFWDLILAIAVGLIYEFGSDQDIGFLKSRIIIICIFAIMTVAESRLRFLPRKKIKRAGPR